MRANWNHRSTLPESPHPPRPQPDSPPPPERVASRVPAGKPDPPSSRSPNWKMKSPISCTDSTSTGPPQGDLPTTDGMIRRAAEKILKPEDDTGDAVPISCSRLANCEPGQIVLGKPLIGAGRARCWSVPHRVRLRGRGFERGFALDVGRLSDSSASYADAMRSAGLHRKRCRGCRWFDLGFGDLLIVDEDLFDLQVEQSGETKGGW
jgi:hypothetical protein